LGLEARFASMNAFAEKEADFRELVQSIQRAGELMEDERHFRLPVKGKRDPIFRERVYCYELYHRLRQVLEGKQEFRYALHGEVDKEKHPIIAKKCGRKIPDLLVHVPGEMEHNLAVIEVKPSTASLDGLKKDIKTLRCFKTKASYHRGIMLIYGDGTDEPPVSIEIARKLIGLSTILLMWHKGPGARIESLNGRTAGNGT